MQARQPIIVSHGHGRDTSKLYAPGEKVPQEIAKHAPAGAVGPEPPSSPPPVVATPVFEAPAATPATDQAPALAPAVETKAEPVKEPQPVKAESKEPVAVEIPTTRKAVLVLKKVQAMQLCTDLGVLFAEDEKLAAIQEKLIRELGIKD